MARVSIKPDMLLWACERAGLAAEDLAGRLPNLTAWLRGEILPTLKQVEDLAKATHTPVGYLFLNKPPVERLPIPDFRTMVNQDAEHPSPDLFDTVCLCQQRQEWYREAARISGDRPLAFVGSASRADSIEHTATSIRQALGFDLEARRACRTWAEALRMFIGQTDDVGVLVMTCGVVGNNNHRKLDPDEFRGFALSDELAPLVFINGADTKSAQMFTLAHELAHVWLGQTALSNDSPASKPAHAVERWCNQVAAELLVPLAAFRNEYQPDNELQEEMERLAKCYKVSTLVVLRRMHDAGGLTEGELWNAYRTELARLQGIKKNGGGGGDFYLTQAARVSKRFARELITSTLEGRTAFTDAFRMLGIRKMATFRELGNSLGVS